MREQKILFNPIFFFVETMGNPIHNCKKVTREDREHALLHASIRYNPDTVGILMETQRRADKPGLFIVFRQADDLTQLQNQLYAISQAGNAHYG